MFKLISQTHCTMFWIKMGSTYLHVILIVMVIQEDLVMVMKYLAGTYVQNNFFLTLGKTMWNILHDYPITMTFKCNASWRIKNGWRAKSGGHQFKMNSHLFWNCIKLKKSKNGLELIIDIIWSMHLGGTKVVWFAK